MTLYVFGKSKKEINERLANGETVYGENYSMFGGGGTYKLGDDGTDRAVIKVFEKYSQGNPVAKAYGTYNKSKNRI